MPVRAGVSRLIDRIYRHRYDLFAAGFLAVVVVWFFWPVIVHADAWLLDVGAPDDTRRFLDDSLGLWNPRVNTPTTDRLPRLLLSVVPWLASALAGYSQIVLARGLLLASVALGVCSSYAFSGRLLPGGVVPGSSDDDGLSRVFARAVAALFFVCNPWVLASLSRIYLFFGYALMPLVLVFADRLFAFSDGSSANFSGRKPVSPESIWHAFGLAITLSLSAVAPALFALDLALVAAFWLANLARTRLRAGRWIIRASVARLLLVCALFLMCSWYWLVPALGATPGREPLREAVSRYSFGAIDRVEPGIGSGGVTTIAGSSDASVGAFILLRSGETTGPADRAGIGYVVSMALFLLLAVSGFLRSFRSRYVVPVLGAAAVGSLLLAFRAGRAEVDLSTLTAASEAGRLLPGVMLDSQALAGVLAMVYALLLVPSVYEAFRPRRVEGAGSTLLRASLLVATLVACWGLKSPERDMQTVDHGGRSVAKAEQADLSRTQSDGRTLGISIDSSSRELLRGSAFRLVADDGSMATGAGVETEPVGPIASSVDLVGIEDGSLESLYLSFVKYHLLRGTTRDVGALLAPFGANRIVFPDLIDGFEGGTAGFVEQVLGYQRDIRQMSEYTESTVYEVAVPDSDAFVMPVAVHTPRGFGSVLGLANLSPAMARRAAFIYTHADTSSFLHKVREGDLIEVDSFDELWLGELPDDLYRPVSPPTGTTPELGWSGFSSEASGWLDFLSRHGIDPIPFEHDMQLGLAVTDSSITLTHGFDRMRAEEGELIANLDTIERLDVAFHPDPTGRHEIIVSPTGAIDRTHSLGLAPTGSTQLPRWAVGGAGPIPVAPETAYRIRLAVSGSGVDAMQLRFRAFDSDGESLAWVYEASPDAPSRNGFVDISGIVVTPSEASSLSIEMVTTTPPAEKTRWWIRAFELRDLTAFQRANTIRFDLPSVDPGTHHLYLRSFVSPAGGTLIVRVFDQEYTIDTRAGNRSEFRWFDLGLIPADAEPVPVELTNGSGLQAVNAFAFVGEDDFAELRFPARLAIDRGAVYLSLEAESAFDSEGAIESTRLYPELSSGRGVVSDDAILTREIEIVKNGTYRFVLRAAGNRDRSTIRVRLVDLDDGSEISIPATLAAALPTIASRRVINVDAAGYGEYRSLATHVGALPDLQTVLLDPIALTRGRYRLQIELASRVANLVSLYGMRAFDTETLPESLVPLLGERYCSDCEQTDASMMQRSFSNGEMTVSYDPTCSCDWYVYSSSAIGVKAQDEYVVRFDLRSELLAERSVRTLFLDDRSRVLAVHELFDVPAKQSAAWRSFEEVVRVPPGANQMLVQIWAKGDRVRESTLQIRDLVVLPHKELPLIDSVSLFESRAFAIIAGGRGSPNPLEVISSPDHMSHLVTIPDTGAEEALVRIDLAVHPLWTIQDGNVPRSLALRLGGVGSGFFTRSDVAELTMRRRGMYYFGLALLVLSAPLCWLLHRRSRGLPFVSLRPLRRFMLLVRLWKRRYVDSRRSEE